MLLVQLKSEIFYSCVNRCFAPLIPEHANQSSGVCACYVAAIKLVISLLLCCVFKIHK